MSKQYDFHGRTIHALTVSDLRKRLEELPDDLVLTHQEWDSEWGITYNYVLTGLFESGLLRTGMIGSIRDESWIEDD